MQRTLHLRDLQNANPARTAGLRAAIRRSPGPSRVRGVVSFQRGGGFWGTEYGLETDSQQREEILLRLQRARELERAKKYPRAADVYEMAIELIGPRNPQQAAKFLIKAGNLHARDYLNPAARRAAARAFRKAAMVFEPREPELAHKLYNRADRMEPKTEQI